MADKILHGLSEDAAALCSALGLNPSEIYSLTLRLKVGELAQVDAEVWDAAHKTRETITKPLAKEQLDQAARTIMHYELHRIDAA
jgi:hypothetical protein